MGIFSDLKTTTDTDPAGYRGFAGYPSAYQAAEFPAYGKEVRITGNNQAFFFVAGVKDASAQVIDVQPNDTAFKKLIANIIGQGSDADQRPLMRLQIDADVFENPERFVAKYQTLRSEPTQAERERLLGKEAETIRAFVNDGGMYSLVRDAVAGDLKTRSGTPPTKKQIDGATQEFFAKNFRLEGVRTQQPLQFATWEIASPDGVFQARQEYKNSTYMVERPWQLGLKTELTALGQDGHAGAKQVLDAVSATREMPTTNLTYGYPPRGLAGRPAPGRQLRPDSAE